jgi:tripartite-type tricarboxylate transporter receptor subunit TctC
MNRRHLLLAAAAALCRFAAHAEGAYPQRPVTLVVPISSV